MSILDYGAAADGTTNDFAALNQAVNSFGAGGGTVTIPDRPIAIGVGAYPLGAWIQIPDNVVIRGLGSRSEIRFSANDANYHELFRVAGNNVQITNLRLTRVSDVYGLMITIRASAHVWLHNLTITGNVSQHGTHDFHAILLHGNLPDVIDDLTIANITVHDCDFGLLQNSQDTVTVKNVLVHGSTFTHNYRSDLEFNAPNSLMQNVRVQKCSFTENQSQDPSAGWGVGFAKVKTAEVSWCYFRDNVLNPFHIEDSSADILIERNVFEAASTQHNGFAAHIIMLSDTHDVTIRHNRFDATKQPNAIDCVYVGPGGNYPNPYNVTVTNNTFVLNSSVNASRILGNYGASNVVSTPNAVMTTTP